MDCKTWLTSHLADGQLHICDEVRKRANEAGFSRAELKKARNELGVKAFHQFGEEGSTDNWFWYLEV